MPYPKTGRPQLILAAILVAYALLAVLFAVYTPPWQAPDEPAHYNYVRYLAEKGQFPVLQMGDYSQVYLDWIKEAGFPPILSIDSIRYEFHQPPLYYLLAAPLFAVAGGALLPLRLFSVLLGAGLVCLAYLIGRRLFPAWPALAAAVAAFVAFLPQHLATVAQVGNDVLAELLVAAVLLLLLGWVRRDAAWSAQAARRESPGARGRAAFALLGVLCGLVLITKTTAYLAVLLAGAVLIWEWRRERATLPRVAAELGWVVVPAALISFPWYLRDILIYGWPDFLGLARHDSIVIGQMRPVEYLARFGWGSYVQRLVTYTFDSFWGKFGWLGVPMDSRVYTALAIFSAVVGVGLLARIAFLRGPPVWRPLLRSRCKRQPRPARPPAAGSQVFCRLCLWRRRAAGPSPPPVRELPARLRPAASALPIARLLPHSASSLARPAWVTPWGFAAFVSCFPGWSLPGTTCNSSNIRVVIFSPR